LPGHRARARIAGNPLLIAVLAAAVAVRLAALWQASSTPLLSSWRWNQSDMGFFHAMAERIAAGDLLLNGTFHPMEHHWRKAIARGYLQRHPEAAAGTSSPVEAERRLWDRWLGPKIYYQEPLYTYLLAAALKLPGDGAHWMIAAQMAAGVLTILLVAVVTRRCFGAAAGNVAAVLALLYAPLLFYEMVLLRASLIALAGAALVLVWCETVRRDEARWWLAAGALTGIAVLLKSVFLPFAAAGAVHAAVTARANRDAAAQPAPALRRAAAVVAGVLLGLLPLVARNVAVGAPPFALAAPGVANVIFGLGPGADPRPGASTYDFGSYGEIMYRTGGAATASLVEMFRLHDSPGAFLGLIARKFLAVWHGYEIPNNVNFNYFEPRIGVLRLLPLRFVLLAPLGLIGLAVARRDVLRRWPLFLAPVTAVAVLTVFANNARTRVPLVVGLIPFAALALLRLGEWAAHGPRRKAAAGAAAVLLLALGMSRGFPSEAKRIRDSDHVLALEAYYLPEAAAAEAAGDPARAAGLLREAARQGPEWVRSPSLLKSLTPQERVLAAIYRDVHLRCAAGLEEAGAPAEASTHRDLARRLERLLR
jgi:4-amino-4-deoxy-L-arabinose transferase-like glycosyltransferase